MRAMNASKVVCLLTLAHIALLSAWTIAAVPNVRCLACHEAGGTVSADQAPFIDVTALQHSVHDSLTCVDCHAIDPDKPHKGKRTVLCVECHQSEATSFAKSPHVVGRTTTVEKLPTCITCHGWHDVRAVADTLSRTHHRNSVSICVECHEDPDLTAQVTALPNADAIRAYENSIHGRALLQKGTMAAPACVDCHGSHTFLPSDDPESPVYKTHIAATCGKCHHEIAAQYTGSVHGAALTAGVTESPTCTNCHGEHDIRPPSEPGSKVYPTTVSKTCSDCHASPAVVAKFGLKADRIATFTESFHGAASELGDTRVANCASCHGVHNIYPQKDPRSQINAANIQTTCGECHEDLPADFAQGAVHTSATTPESGGEFYVRKFYIYFISGLILAFILYRLLEYKRRVKRI